MKRSTVWVSISLMIFALSGSALAAENSSTKDPPAVGETKGAPKKTKKAKPAAQSFVVRLPPSTPRQGPCR